MLWLLLILIYASLFDHLLAYSMHQLLSFEWLRLTDILRINFVCTEKKMLVTLILVSSILELAILILVLLVKGSILGRLNPKHLVLYAWLFLLILHYLWMEMFILI